MARAECSSMLDLMFHEEEASQITLVLPMLPMLDPRIQEEPGSFPQITLVPVLASVLYLDNFYLSNHKTQFGSRKQHRSIPKWTDPVTMFVNPVD